MEKESKRFEDWTDVDCNDCARYWDSSCDGVSKESKRQCNSFLATRRIVIPEQLKTLMKANKRILVAYILLMVSNVGIWMWIIWRMFQ